ncbi:hypothetical protein [Herbaspirillum huttiense]|uniref:Uncharacterized protein n=1 Tax=Herbaspirillum huttiense subsp. lycopersici TaxID=3074428 RepID=A0ABU2EFY0_9BURK|nr:hypothetical protein [Herbaspirillum huttiense]MDR9847052.1 hypothetical protein [Herbaspirillum huttiense SE1]
MKQETYTKGETVTSDEFGKILAGSRGKFTAIDVPGHGGCINVVTEVDGDIHGNRDCEARLEYLLEALNGYPELKSKPDLSPALNILAQALEEITHLCPDKITVTEAQKALDSVANLMGRPKSCPCCAFRARYTKADKAIRQPDHVECVQCGLNISSDEPGAALKAWNWRA